MWRINTSTSSPVMAFFSVALQPLLCSLHHKHKRMKRSNIFFFYALLLFILEQRHSPYIFSERRRRKKNFFCHSCCPFFLRSVKLFPFLISIMLHSFSPFPTHGSLACCRRSVYVYLYDTCVVRCHNGCFVSCAVFLFSTSAGTQCSHIKFQSLCNRFIWGRLAEVEVPQLDVLSLLGEIPDHQIHQSFTLL